MTEPGLMRSSPSVLGSGAVGRFKNGAGVANVGSWPHAQAAHDRRCGIGEIIPIQVHRRQDGIFIGAGLNLLKNAVGNAIVHHHLVFPLTVAVGLPNGVENALHRWQASAFFLRVRAS
jgi:hypothetical protein